MTTSRIAVIGAGNVGGNLGSTLTRAGFAVAYGSTNSPPARAIEGADIVFFAVPAAAAVELARSLSSELTGKIIVDCTNPLIWKDGPVWDPPQEGSVAAAIAAAVPTARVVKGFNTFGAEFHGDPKTKSGPATVYLAGDDAEAKTQVAQLATTAGFAPIDAGPLRNASVLENVAMLWIHLASVGGQGRDFVFQMQGRA